MQSLAFHGITGRLLSVTGVTGIAYPPSWLAGLSIPAPSPPLSAAGAEITAALAGHATAVAAQFALTEGLPAAGLAVVSMALARTARQSGSARAPPASARGRRPAAAARRPGRRPRQGRARSQGCRPAGSAGPRAAGALGRSWLVPLVRPAADTGPVTAWQILVAGQGRQGRACRCRSACIGEFSRRAPPARP